MFDVVELTIDGFHHALTAHETTCEEVVATYLRRIRLIDPTLRSIIHLSRTALAQAKAKDQIFRATGPSVVKDSPLFGVPVILKDTYLTSDLPTTCGSKSMLGLSSHDGHVVRKLRDAGAIILAKANCHEFCLQGCTFSSLGGQTLNPYDLTRTPGGSSGGTAAAIAANLGLVGCGGDTMNSIRSPASACCLVGLRPSRGQVGTSGIFPVAPTQDAAGPICRTVADCRTLYHVMRGVDPDDESTHDANHGFESAPVGDRKLRVGVLQSYFPKEGEPDAAAVLGVMSSALSSLSSIAELITIDESTLSTFDIPTLIANYDVQSFELQHTFDAFLSSKHIISAPHQTLSSVAASGAYDSRALSFVWHNTLAPLKDQDSPYTMNSTEHRSRLVKINTLKATLEATLANNHLDCIIYPHQRRLVMKVGTTMQEGRNGLLTALTGLPSLCVPAGLAETGEEEAKLGVPVGMEIIAGRWEDEKLLEIGEIISNILNVRQAPVLDVLSGEGSYESRVVL